MRKLFLVILTILFSITCFGIEKVKGKILWKNDSSTDVSFVIPCPNKGIFIACDTIDSYLYTIESEIEYYNSGSDKKNMLKPEQVKEIQFLYRNDSIRMISYNNTLELLETTSPIFLRILIDGKVKLYCYYVRRSRYQQNYFNQGTTSTFQGYYSAPKPIILDENGIFFKINELNFKKEMKKHFSNCKELISKIVVKEEYTYGDLHKIIKEYNKCVK